MSQRILILLDDATRAIAFARAELTGTPAPGPTPTPPPGPGPVPPPPPGGNPGAIQPPLPWPAGSPQSEVKHVIVPSGYIFGYVVPPIPDNYPGATSVVLTQGRDANSPGEVTVEYCVSRTPGVIDPNAGPGFYYKTVGGNYWQTALFQKALGTPYLDPALGPWYFNIRWTQPEGIACGYSLQWALGA